MSGRVHMCGADLGSVKAEAERNGDNIGFSLIEKRTQDSAYALLSQEEGIAAVTAIAEAIHGNAKDFTPNGYESWEKTITDTEEAMLRWEFLAEMGLTNAYEAWRQMYYVLNDRLELDANQASGRGGK